MELKHYPDRVLRERCEPLRRIDDEVLRRAREMLELMYESDGLGLAASQVAWPRRLVTLDIEGEHRGERIFVNPRIVDSEGHVELEEGCLSLPGIRVQVPRAEKITLVTFTIEGRRVEAELEGLAAVAWQHELDHLNGTLIIDRIPPTRLMTVRDRLRRLERGEVPEQEKAAEH